MKQRAGGQEERRIKLKTLNPCITCMLCKGYMIDATTITECLHTFCKSCIVKFLDDNNSCPKCHQVIHQSHPLSYISHDRTMHDIVFKLVPNLKESELLREEEFYKRNNLINPKNVSDDKDFEMESEESCKDGKKENNEQDKEEDYHRSDEQVSVCLQSFQSQLQQVKRRYIRCSVQTTITHLKKFLALKLYKDMSKFKEIELMCNHEIMGKDHTLKFVCMTRWRSRDYPLVLHYRPTLDL